VDASAAGGGSLMADPHAMTSTTMTTILIQTMTATANPTSPPSLVSQQIRMTTFELQMP
jgi:hypothetical protein